MLVCHCKALTDRDLRGVVRRGARSANQVTRACGAGGVCGGCRPAIDEIVDEEQPAERSGARVPHMRLAPSR